MRMLWHCVTERSLALPSVALDMRSVPALLEATCPYLPDLLLQFTDQELRAFLEAYKGRVDSVHEDTEVSVFEVEHSAPWGLDRLDQTALPLNLEFDYYDLGTGVNVYIVDTVRGTQYPV